MKLDPVRQNGPVLCPTAYRNFIEREAAVFGYAVVWLKPRDSLKYVLTKKGAPL